jgi:hypothetical protein
MYAASPVALEVSRAQRFIDDAEVRAGGFYELR